MSEDLKPTENNKPQRNLAYLVAGIVIIVLIGALLLWYPNYKSDQEKKSSSSSSSSQSSAGYASTYDFISRNGNYSVVKQAIDKAGLAENLKTDTGLTIFLPNNSAFDKIPAQIKNDLLTNPASAMTLASLLSHHLVSPTAQGSGTSTKIADLETIAKSKNNDLSTANGEMISVVAKDSNIYVNNAKIVEKDVVIGKSVIQGIDSVLLPSVTALEKIDPSANNLVLGLLKNSATTSLTTLDGSYKGKSYLLTSLTAFPDTTIGLKSGALTIDAKGLNLGLLQNEALKVNGVYPDVMVTANAQITSLTGYGTDTLLGVKITKLDVTFSVGGTALPAEASVAILQGLQTAGLTLPTVNATAPLDTQLIFNVDSQKIKLSSKPNQSVVIQFDGSKV